MADPTDRSEPPDGYVVWEEDTAPALHTHDPEWPWQWSASPVDPDQPLHHETSKAEAVAACWAHRDRIYQDGVREGLERAESRLVWWDAELESNLASMEKWRKDNPGRKPNPEERASYWMTKGALEILRSLLLHLRRDDGSSLATHDAAVRRAQERETLGRVAAWLDDRAREAEQDARGSQPNGLQPQRVARARALRDAHEWVRARLKELE